MDSDKRPAIGPIAQVCRFTASLRNVFQLLRVPQHRRPRRLAWLQVIAAAQAVACDESGLNMPDDRNSCAARHAAGHQLLRLPCRQQAAAAAGPPPCPRPAARRSLQSS